MDGKCFLTSRENGEGESSKFSINGKIASALARNQVEYFLWEAESDENLESGRFFLNRNAVQSGALDLSKQLSPLLLALPFESHSL